ncbi:MAG: Mur ligase domain-containing protein [Bacteroidales bacterium]|jgi:UDP-N-acetylmuramate: L-alanyl-gamma-D-glutamyl-meso-diaminopimelate ligase|nr:Mur ligase domain-containing protein [Bacteroidales bacterium]
MKRIHFIAIGGSAMHNLAIALHLKGYNISGSDDEIFDPARERLAKYGLLPAAVGWFAERITPDLEAVILGMHAREDNPELLRAKELGLKIYSYPEYLYEQSRDKKRVVIGGSHGKTTVTAMILHVLHGLDMQCDYMIGAQLDGFEVMVRLSEDAPVMIIEGDEYLTSPIDRRPKFHLYHPDIAVINGIAWDHINVFPTFENYVSQFAIFAQSIEPNGALVYVDNDTEAVAIAAALASERADVTVIGAGTPEYEVRDGVTFFKGTPLRIFGKHNLQNLNVAWNVCRLLGVSDGDFLKQIASFAGASRRLELIASNSNTAVYKDFAHSPSKLQATILAVKEQYPKRKLVACIELHTFSSLSKEFLSHYNGCMDKADMAIVYFNPHAVEHKKLPPITCEIIYETFGRSDLKVYNDSTLLLKDLLAQEWNDSNLLWMTSGNFDGINEQELAEKIVTCGQQPAQIYHPAGMPNDNQYE